MQYKILNDDKSGPYIYCSTGAHDSNPTEIVPLIKGLTDGASFRLVSFLAEDWNADFSPWQASAVFGKNAFDGKGPETLQWLKEECIPSVEDSTKHTRRFVAGYSLSGLFALWTALSTDLFDGVASCSGSLWFPKWLEFVKENRLTRNMDIYLSLGDTEELTKNAVMSTVGDCTRETYDILASEDKETGHVTLEWNHGGHFNNPTLRTAKGIAWLINNQD